MNRSSLWLQYTDRTSYSSRVTPKYFSLKLQEKYCILIAVDCANNFHNISFNNNLRIRSTF